MSAPVGEVDRFAELVLTWRGKVSSFAPTAASVGLSVFARWGREASSSVSIAAVVVPFVSAR